MIRGGVFVPQGRGNLVDLGYGDLPVFRSTIPEKCRIMGTNFLNLFRIMGTI